MIGPHGRDPSGGRARRAARSSRARLCRVGGAAVVGPHRRRTPRPPPNGAKPHGADRGLGPAAPEVVVVASTVRHPSESWGISRGGRRSPTGISQRPLDDGCGDTVRGPDVQCVAEAGVHTAFAAPSPSPQRKLGYLTRRATPAKPGYPSVRWDDGCGDKVRGRYVQCVAEAGVHTAFAAPGPSPQRKLGYLTRRATPAKTGYPSVRWDDGCGDTVRGPHVQCVAEAGVHTAFAAPPPSPQRKLGYLTRWATPAKPGYPNVRWDDGGSSLGSAAQTLAA
jgi:hypothetical protein